MRGGGGPSRERVWLVDDRVPPRHLQVTHHPEQGVVVLSIWHENVCTATFQLPVADSPAVIDVLVAAFAGAAGWRTAVAAPAPARWDRLRAWARARLARPA